MGRGIPYNRDMETNKMKPFGGTGGHPNYRTNQDKATHKGMPLDTTACCCWCGKKALGHKLHAYLTNMGEFSEQRSSEGSDDLGFYPLGGACARELRKAGIPTYRGDWTTPGSIKRIKDLKKK